MKIYINNKYDKKRFENFKAMLKVMGVISVGLLINGIAFTPVAVAEETLEDKIAEIEQEVRSEEQVESKQEVEASVVEDTINTDHATSPGTAFQQNQ